MPPFAALAHHRAPRAARKPTRRVVHGVMLDDDYAWLRARNWQEVIEEPEKVPADIARYLRSENRYAAAGFRPMKALQKQLIAEMRGRMVEDESAPPWSDGPFLYFERYRKGAQYSLCCRKPVEGGREQIMLDGPKEARGLDYFDIGGIAVSPDHRLMAWAADLTGSESYVIRVRELGAGGDHDRLERTSGDIVWGRDGHFFYYIELDPSQRPYRVMRHRLGEPQEADVEIYREADSGWFVSLDRTQDDRYAFIDIHDHETTEVLLLDLDDPREVPEPVFPREAGIEYEIDHHEGRMIIRTNHADRGGRKPEDYRILALPVGETDTGKAEVLVDEVPGRAIQSVNVLKNWLIWSSLGEDGPAIHARNWRNGTEKLFRPRAVVGDISGAIGPEYDSATLRLTFSSPTEPEVTLDHNLDTGEEVILKRQEVPSGHDAARYTVERAYAPTPDGETVPITILRLASTPLDGTAPCLLYGYGAYGYAMDADFETDRLSLVDRGFLYAIAHIRGGMEKGFRWYREGKREKKINSFRDFITAADFLLQKRYVAPRRLVAHGVSAGGMLMGGIANMAGERFAGIIAEVPFVDSLNTILDPTLPLTPPEWVEWGNPIEDVKAFEAMRAYSPYDNIAAKEYPPMFIVGGLTDPRVTYWEPAKFVAKLRATMAGGGPVLFRTNMGAGHDGASGRFRQLDDVARVYAFALEVTGMLPARESESQELASGSQRRAFENRGGP
ncbi:MAG: S9 family peptidase [Methylobacterium sp.]|nr:S9 family peptidase [Methylobacterium sp.]